MTQQQERRLTVEGPDGRALDVLVAGPEDGIPLVFHNGTPMGLVAYAPMIAAAAERGVRMIYYSRPGYGGSPPQPGRVVADAPADVALILDELDAGLFLTAGWSGGGPHALACAALLPGRCLAAASLAGVAPRRAVGLDWLDGMAEENVAEFDAAAAGRPELTVFLEAAAAELRGITGPRLADALGGLVSGVDQAAAVGPFADYLAAGFDRALSPGIDGWRDDDLAFVADWGFGLDALGGLAQVAVWQGGQDKMVPAAHGRWLAGSIPGSRAHLLPAEGHLSLVANLFGEILDDLLELAARRDASAGPP
jgi:pimeloyl-ACP methyl ester carboxylesterase